MSSGPADDETSRARALAGPAASGHDGDRGDGAGNIAPGTEGAASDDAGHDGAGTGRTGNGGAGRVGRGGDGGPGRVATRVRRDPRRRRALLEAADRVILREGPEASMASIAAEAGISKPILYRHFGDKSGLYQALADRHVRVLMDAVRAAFRRPGPIRERTRGAIDTYLAAIAANRSLYRFLVHRAGAEDTATHSTMSTLIRGLGGEIAEILLTEGLVGDPVRVRIWSHATVGMAQAAGEWWLDHPEVPRATVVDGLVGLILDGLTEVARR